MNRLVARPALALVASLLASLLVAVFSCSPASAQSGRKPPPRRPDPVPETPATPPTPAASQEDAPAISVSAAKFNFSFSLPDYICDDAFRACMGRFKNSRAFSVLAGDDMNRKKAIELAKSGKDTYVLLIEFTLENDTGSMTTASYYRNIIATYTVFSPETGKSRSTGRVYFDAYRSSGSLGSVVRRSGNYTPEEAGQKIADDVMGSLITSTPGGGLPMPR